MVDENPYKAPVVDESKWFTGGHLGGQIQQINWQVCAHIRLRVPTSPGRNILAQSSALYHPQAGANQVGTKLGQYHMSSSMSNSIYQTPLLAGLTPPTRFFPPRVPARPCLAADGSLCKGGHPAAGVCAFQQQGLCLRTPLSP